MTNFGITMEYFLFEASVPFRLFSLGVTTEHGETNKSRAVAYLGGWGGAFDHTPWLKCFDFVPYVFVAPLHGNMMHRYMVTWCTATW